MAEAKEKILQIENLDITFRTTAGPVHAIRGVNIDLHKGETVAIVGESGSGKSVTMKAAMGILAGNATVSGGTILFSYHQHYFASSQFPPLCASAVRGTPSA